VNASHASALKVSVPPPRSFARATSSTSQKAPGSPASTPRTRPSPSRLLPANPGPGTRAGHSRRV